MKRILLTTSFFIFSVMGTFAQSGSGKDSGTETSTRTDNSEHKLQDTETSKAKFQSTDKPDAEYGEGRRWSFYITLSGVFDSNISHDTDGINDYGMVAAAGVYFRNRSKNPNFEFSYEIGQHAYLQTNRWDRTSHNLRVRSENKLGKHWVSESSGEISLKGSTEDRELTNRYSLVQNFQYLLTRDHRFNFGGAYRLKKYDSIDRERNSTNPYLETGYEKRFSAGKRKLEFSYRYEKNRAVDERFSYIRWTYGVQLKTPLLKKGRLTVEARYRPQKYSRLVELQLPSGGTVEVPRRDKRWIFDAEWQRTIWQGLELALIYKYEQRDSNDNRRDFTANAGNIVLRYRRWK